MLAVFKTSVGIMEPLTEILNHTFILETSRSAGDGIGNHTVLSIFAFFSLLYTNSFGLVFK